MSTCKKCGKKFHACSNCCFDHEWEWDYCSDKCYKLSPDYIQDYRNKPSNIEDLKETKYQVFYIDKDKVFNFGYFKTKESLSNFLKTLIFEHLYSKEDFIINSFHKENIYDLLY